MQWDEIRQQFPHQWLIVEAIASHSEGNKWIPDEMAVIEMIPDASQVMPRYAELRRQYPERRFVFLHTDREVVEIERLPWLGIRRLK